MPKTSATRILPNMDLASVGQRSGRYVNMDIPLTGLSSSGVTLVGAQSQNLLFTLPDTVYNLSKSTITYNYQIVAPADRWLNIYEDTLGLELASGITFYPNQGTNLVQLTNPAMYAKIMPKLDTPLDVFQSLDDSQGLHEPNGSVNVVPVLVQPQAGNSYALPAAATNSALSLAQPLYVRTPAAGTAAAATYTVRRCVPLGLMTGTIFALVHDQYFGGVMNLSIATAPVSQFGFCNATAIWTGGATALDTGLPNAANVVLSNIYLNLAVQDDQLIAAEFRALARSGKLHYQVPYLTTLSATLPGTGLQSANVNISSAFGQKLKRIVNTSQFVTVPATGNGAWDISNSPIAAAPYQSKITYYGTSLNGQQLQRKTNNNCVMASTALPSNVLDDFRENRRFLQESCIQDVSAYQQNWFHCDSFSDRSNIPWSLSSDQIDEGYVLGLGNTQYLFTANTVAPLTVWSFIETIREIVITPSGPVWEMSQ